MTAVVAGLLLAAPQQPPAPQPIPPPPVVVRQVDVQRIVVNNAWPDQQFERWVFGDLQTTDGAKRRMETLLALKLDEIDRACTLTADQKRKLRLLGLGDAKRVLDEFEAARRKFAELGNDSNRLTEVAPLTQPVQAAIRGGPFQPGTLAGKGLRHTLTAEQLARVEAVDRERQAVRHQAQIELAVVLFEDAVPLTAAQRDALLALLKAETRPLPATGGQYDQYLLMYQIGKLPESKVKAVLSESQARSWAGMVNQYGRVIQNLRQQGVIPADDDPPAAKEAP